MTLALCREVAETVLPPQGANFPQICGRLPLFVIYRHRLIPVTRPKVTLGLCGNFSQLKFRRLGILGERFADVTDQLVPKFFG
jgi:hypothetical protein